MKTILFKLTDKGIADREKFLNDPTFVVKDRLFSPRPSADSVDVVYYTYESLEDQTTAEKQCLADDQERLKSLCKIAAELAEDLVLPQLKNAGQRQMYMTSKGIGRQDGLDIIELLKPEMTSVLEWGRSS